MAVRPVSIPGDYGIVLGKTRQYVTDQAAAVIIHGGAIIDFVLVRCAPNNARIAKQFQVPGYTRLAQSGDPDDFADGQFALPKPGEQTQAGRILEYANQFREFLEFKHLNIGI